VPARPPHFFDRNALLAALCVALVVVETRHRGGARNAAKHARSLGRTVLAVPTVPWNPTGAGCLTELRLGAELLSSPRDVLRVLARQNAHAVALPHQSQAAVALGAQLLPALAGAPAINDSPARPPGRARRARTKRSKPARSDRSKTAIILDGYPMGGDARRVVDYVGNRAVHPDEICRGLDLPARRVQELLLTLTLEGILVSDSSTGRVSRIRP
jgi:DNA processing protein